MNHGFPSLPPNQTVEKVHFSYFLRKTPFENQESMSDNFQVLGFFDSLNYRLQVTAYSVRSSLAPASGGRLSASVWCPLPWWSMEVPR